MEKVLVLLLLLVVALYTDTANSLLENGDVCLLSKSCKNGCCQISSKIIPFHCTDRAAENEECSPKKQTFLDFYAKCPCASDLTCVKGVCKSAAEPREVSEMNN